MIDQERIEPVVAAADKTITEFGFGEKGSFI